MFEEAIIPLKVKILIILKTNNDLRSGEINWKGAVPKLEIKSV